MNSDQFSELFLLLHYIDRINYREAGSFSQNIWSVPNGVQVKIIRLVKSIKYRLTKCTDKNNKLLQNTFLNL